MIIERLESTKLFKEELIKKEYIRTKQYKSGQFISDYFDDEYYVGVIDFGEVVVYCISSDGTEVSMSSLTTGDVFGIANVFEESALESVLQCKTFTNVIFYPKKYFVEMLETDTSVCIQYAKYCNRKIQFLLNKVEFLMIQSCRVKVIEYLLQHEDESHMVALDCTKEELSKVLGISRAALYRELQYLSKCGCIEVSKRAFYVLDRKQLCKILFENE